MKCESPKSNSKSYKTANRIMLSGGIFGVTIGVTTLLANLFLFETRYGIAGSIMFVAVGVFVLFSLSANTE